MAASLIANVCLRACLLMLLNSPAWAGTYPDRPIRLVVPYSAGGTVDIVARLVAESLSVKLKQPIIVENKAGAGGSIGMAEVANATRDGYTLGIGTTGPLSIMPFLHRRPQYDPLVDFTPISLIAATPQTLAVHHSVPAQSIAEFVAYAKARPGLLNFASPGIGSSAHLAGELFKAAANIDIVHIPYKGNREALKDVASGEVSIVFSPFATVEPLVRSGQLRLIGIASAERLATMPEVPTFVEAGLPEVRADAWFGLVGPPGIPDAVTELLASELANVLHQPLIQKEFARHGVEHRASTPRMFRAFIAGQLPIWENAVNAAGLQKD